MQGNKTKTVDFANGELSIDDHELVFNGGVKTNVGLFDGMGPCWVRTGDFYESKDRRGRTPMVGRCASDSPAWANGGG